MAKFISGLFIALIVVVVCGGFWLQLKMHESGPKSDTASVVIFEVTPGQSLKKVAEQLESQGLVSSSFAIRMWVRALNPGLRPKVGEYELNTQMSSEEIMNVLASGRSRERKITIAEGLNIFEIADIIAAQKIATRDEFLRMVRDPKFVSLLLGQPLNSLEGYLFPETYMITKYTKLDELIKSMVSRSLKVYNELQQQRAQESAHPGQPVNLDRHQLFILASIIEKETGAPEERELISSVFHNRMKKGMRLQTDPTVIYGVWAARGQPLANIRRDDLLTPNPYNTYTNQGLPVGPIANPGREAIFAAARPAVSPYLFFVSRNAGTHKFSATLAEHEAGVRQFQIDPRAREGKSWRQLKQPAAKSP